MLELFISLTLLSLVTTFGRLTVANLTVRVQEGEVRGLRVRSALTHELFCAFLSIPYAKPPIGELRFRAPEPIGQWKGVRTASEESDLCIQVAQDSEPTGSEDCLYLNIYTPEEPSEHRQKKAVMIFIHGGQFHGEGSQIYGPDVLMNYDVVLVTFNYRLHVFGFLNTGTPSCPGNAGLKDQLLAIKWVKTNIATFGGDPENITLFGQGSGAVSIHLHMLSSLSEGLYNRAILQSGNALSPWAIEKNPVSRALEIGKLAGYAGHELEELVKHLRGKPAEKLSKLAHQVFTNSQHVAPGSCANSVFGPSVETIAEGAFLTDFPEVLMEFATPIPTIIGFNEQEGSLYYSEHLHGMMNFVLNDLSIVVRDNFDIDEGDEQAELMAAVQQFYFRNRPVTPVSVSEIVNLYSDLYHMKFYEAFDHLIRSDVPPYINLFAYDGRMNIYKHNILEEIVNVDKIKGAAHGDELGYLFFTPDVFRRTTNVDREVMNLICSLWTNFAKTGKPTHITNVNWEPHTHSQPSFMRIDQTLQVVHEKLREKRFNFWEKWTKRSRW